MKVSIDGLRRNLARAYNETAEAFNDLPVTIPTDDIDRMRDGLVNLRQYIGAMMCMYTDDPEDMCSNLADEAEELVEVY